MKKLSPLNGTFFSIALLISGAVVDSLAWHYGPLTSSILLTVGIGGLTLIFISLFTKHFFGKRKR